MNSDVLENIKKARKRAGLSQSEVAEKLNLSQSAYSKIELGKTPISEFYLYQLPEILNCRLDELLSPEDFKEYRTGLLPEKSILEDAEVRYNRLITDKQNLEKQIELLEQRIRDKEVIINLLQKELKRAEGK